jgi:CRP-like cAMP-binding protein
MIEKLKTYLQNFFTEDETAIICSHFEVVKLEPDQLLIDANTETNLVGFLAEGILKAIETKDDGKEIIHYFWDEGDFFSEADSYFDNNPTRFSVAAARDCTLLCTTKEKLDALEQKITKLREIRAQIGAKIMHDKAKMQETQTKGKTDACYCWFINNYASIAGRLRQKDIASFLNTRETYLSAVVNKIKGK